MLKRFLLLAIFSTSGFTAAAPAAATNNDAAGCQALARADFSTLPDAPTQVMAANRLEATQDAPAYCQVQGYVTPHIGFELRLPDNWNGKFIHRGCGANCGRILTERCADALRRGYACVVSDQGHKSLSWDAKWAYNNLQAEIDWGYRATHVATLAGKAITRHYYSTAPDRSYFMGCSGGGRQGLVEAQRFPHDFDGIIAGAPPTDLSGLVMNGVWNVVTSEDEEGNAVLNHTVLDWVHDAAVKACDRDDGIADGLIGNPAACGFEPRQLLCQKDGQKSCLTAKQVAAINKIYTGAKTSAGEALYTGGPVRGSEREWKRLLVAESKAEAGTDTWMKRIVTDMFRYQLLMPDPGPAWQARDFDFDRDPERLGLMETFYSASNPDLRKFKAAGGKLLVYQGWNDAVVLPLNIVDYYQTVERTLGGRAATQDFFRLFMLPGVAHCGGGEGAYAVDYLSYLEDWVERGKAPDVLMSAHVKNEDGYSFKLPLSENPIEFTRPVYPYPMKAMYTGQGDPDNEANFSAVLPPGIGSRG